MKGAVGCQGVACGRRMRAQGARGRMRKAPLVGFAPSNSVWRR